MASKQTGPKNKKIQIFGREIKNSLSKFTGKHFFLNFRHRDSVSSTKTQGNSRNLLTISKGGNMSVWKYS